MKAWIWKEKKFCLRDDSVARSRRPMNAGQRHGLKNRNGFKRRFGVWESGQRSLCWGCNEVVNQSSFELEWLKAILDGQRKSSSFVLAIQMAACVTMRGDSCVKIPFDPSEICSGRGESRKSCFYFRAPWLKQFLRYFMRKTGRFELSQRIVLQLLVFVLIPLKVTTSHARMTLPHNKLSNTRKEKKRFK